MHEVSADDSHLVTLRTSQTTAYFVIRLRCFRYLLNVRTWLRTCSSIFTHYPTTLEIARLQRDARKNEENRRQKQRQLVTICVLKRGSLAFLSHFWHCHDARCFLGFISVFSQKPCLPLQVDTQNEGSVLSCGAFEHSWDFSERHKTASTLTQWTKKTSVLLFSVLWLGIEYWYGSTGGIVTGVWFLVKLVVLRRHFFVFLISRCTLQI